MVSFLLPFLAIINIVVSVDSTSNSCSISSTGSDIEGPFYSSGAPNRAILYNPDDDGIRLHIVGKVSNLECISLSSIYIDFWQANPSGVYDFCDNGCNRFRGGLYTDSNGNYELFTLYPGIYSERPPHIHFKIFINGQEQLTSQMYFTGFTGSDPWYDANRAMQIYPNDQTNTSYSATFDFIGNWIQPSDTLTTTHTPFTTINNQEIRTTTKTQHEYTTSSVATSDIGTSTSNDMDTTDGSQASTSNVMDTTDGSQTSTTNKSGTRNGVDGSHRSNGYKQIYSIITFGICLSSIVFL